MAILYGLWIQCDQCGEGVGDAGIPIDVPFEVKGTTDQDRHATEREATDHALGNGFVEAPDSRLLCSACAAPEDDKHAQLAPEHPHDYGDYSDVN